MSERKHPPTKRRLDDARKRGEAAVSTDLNAVGAFVGVALALWLGRDAVMHDLAALLDLLVAMASDPAGRWRDLDTASAEILRLITRACVPVTIGGVAGTLLAGFAQTRGMVSFKPLTPDFSKLNPGRLFQNVFSTRSLFTLVKVALKVLLLGGALYLGLVASMEGVTKLAYLPSGAGPELLHSLLVKFVFGAVLLYLPFAALDFAHQRYEFIKRNRMSVEELRHENKDDEGDPYIKARRRQVGRELATEPVAETLEGATVLVTNPTHVAVALRYAPGVTPLPVVIAKGLDSRALALRREAARRGIPVLEDRPLARRLHATVKVGAAIGEEVLKPVARVIRRAMAQPLRAPSSEGVARIG